MSDVTVHPLGVEIARAFLLDWDVVTDLVDTRVSRIMPAQDATPRFPALRLTDVNSVVVTARRWVRMLLQVDCWAARQEQADELGRVVVAVLGESANWQPPGGEAVLGEAEDLAVRSEPDRTLTPHQPRSIVTCHLPIRPNP